MTESQTLVLDMQKRFLTDWNEQNSANDEAHSNNFLAMWSAAAELGLALAIAPDSFGGLGSSGDFQFAYFRQRGELLACPNFSASLAGAWALTDAIANDDLAGNLGSGAIRPALPTFPEFIGEFPSERALLGQLTANGIQLRGQFDIVRGAPFATHLIAPARIDGNAEPFIVMLEMDTVGVSHTSFTMLDGAAAGCVTVAGADLQPSQMLARGSAATKAWAAIQRAMIAATAAEATGVMHAMLNQTVDYVRQRQQFGVAIGSFQTVQHRLAEMLVEIELTHSLALAAFRNLSDPFLASSAKTRANDALQKMADCAVQFHGGIGTTEELALSRYFRRAMTLRGEMGTSEQHFRQIEAALTADLQPAAATRSVA